MADDLLASPKIFTTNPFANPHFQPSRLYPKLSGNGGRITKPKAPTKPVAPYMRYNKLVWDQVKAANPNLKMWEIGRITGQMWRDLDQLSKREFQLEYDIEKNLYYEALKAYHESPAFQTWSTAKSHGLLDENDNVITDGQPPEPIGPAHDDQLVHHVDQLMAVDQPMAVDQLTAVDQTLAEAGQRFRRNHCLMAAIFDQHVLLAADFSSLVDEDQLRRLRTQVNLNIKHVLELKFSLEEAQELHEAKKLRLENDSKRFQENYNRLCERSSKLLSICSTENVVK